MNATKDAYACCGKEYFPMENSLNWPINVGMISVSDNTWWQMYDKMFANLKFANLCIKICYTDLAGKKEDHSDSFSRNERHFTESSCIPGKEWETVDDCIGIDTQQVTASCFGW